MKTNHHCSVVELAGTGVLVEGPAGSGKSSLAFALLEAAQRLGIDCAFICDDQAIIEKQGERLSASAPASIAGLAEIRGHGIVSLKHKPKTVVGLLVRLIDDEQVEQMPPERSIVLNGVRIALVEAPRQHEARAARITLARLALPLI